MGARKHSSNKKWPLSHLKHLKFFQKLFYLEGVLSWYSGGIRLFFLISLFNVSSLNTDIPSFFTFWLPSFLTSQLLFKPITREKISIFTSSILELSTALQVFWSVFRERFF